MEYGFGGSIGRIQTSSTLRDKGISLRVIDRLQMAEELTASATKKVLLQQGQEIGREQ
jgi:hypothetical protein